MKRRLIQLAKPIVERFPKLATLYRYIRDSRFINEIPQQTPFGFKFVGNHQMLNGAFEPEETRIMQRFISQVDVLINVGANIGYYCCLALNKGKHVIAFEPININLQYLFRNIKVNDWESSIEIYPLALSNKVGLVEMYGSGTGASLIRGWAGIPANNITIVPSTTMDNVLNSRLHGKQVAVIVDIEGAELLMLEGALLLIDMEPKPIWMVEVSISEHQPKGIIINPNLQSTFQIFWQGGYEAWTADNQCRIVNPSEVDEIVRTGKDTIYTHNFLFIEKGKKGEYLNS